MDEKDLTNAVSCALLNHHSVYQRKSPEVFRDINIPFYENINPSMTVEYPQGKQQIELHGRTLGIYVRGGNFSIDLMEAQSFLCRFAHHLPDGKDEKIRKLKRENKKFEQEMADIKSKIRLFKESARLL